MQKSFQLVCYYYWYSNKMRGQRDRRADDEAQATGNALPVIDVSEHKPCRIPSLEVARTEQEGVGSGPAALPEMFA